MDLKTSSTYLLIIFIVASQLTSCATVSPTPEIINSTSTSQPTLTSTPEPSTIPSPQPTETNTAIPTPDTPAVISFSELATFTMDRFVPISHEARIQLNRDIASGQNSAFPEDVSAVAPVIIAVNKDTSGGVSVRLSCKPDINCKVRYAVLDGIPMLVWELVVKGLDGTNFRVPLTTAHVLMFDTDSPEWGLNHVKSIGSFPNQLTLNIVLHEVIPGFPPTTDVLKLYEQTEARTKMEQGIIDAITADDAVFLTRADGY